MIGLLQRVASARVEIDGEMVGAIGRGLLVLVWRDIAGAQISRIVEALAAFVKQQIVFVYGQNIAYKGVLAYAPVFYKLYVGDLPAVAEGARQKTQAGRGLALAITGIHHHYRLFGLKILKRHTFTIERLSTEV